MLKGLGDIGQLLKLQKEMKNIQNRLSRATMEGSDPRGLVKAVVNGEFMVTAVTFGESFHEQDRDKAEKAVMQAVNDAVSKIKDYSAAEMDKIKDTIQIPGMDQFLK